MDSWKIDAGARLMRAKSSAARGLRGSRRMLQKRLIEADMG